MRSYGIIGGGAVFFTATAAIGQAIIGAGLLGVYKRYKKASNVEHKVFTGLGGIAAAGVGDPSNVFTSFLCGKISPVLSYSAGAQRQDKMSKILLGRSRCRKSQF